MIEPLRRLKLQAQQRGTSVWRKLLGLFCLLLLLGSLAITLTLNVGPGPRLLAGLLTRLVAPSGVDLSLESVQIVGWGRAALNGVEIGSGLVPSVEGVSASRAVITFDVARVLAGTPIYETISHVTLDTPRARLVSTAGEVEEAEVDDGAMRVAPTVADAPVQPSLNLIPNPLSLTVRSGEVVWEGSENAGSLLFDMEATVGPQTFDVHRFNAYLTMGSEEPRVQVRGEAKVRWSETEGVFGTFAGDLAEMSLGGHVYRLEGFDGAFQVLDDVVHIDSLTGRRGDAVVSVVGQIQPTGTFDLDVAGERLTLEADLPFLAEYGFSGPGAFDGKLLGTLADWALDGVATVGPGTIWGRADVSGEGRLRITPESMTFSGVRLNQYGGEYLLDGAWQFASEQSPGQLDLALNTRSGRLQELLEIFGWQLPVAGRLYGDMRFYGNLDAITAEGNVEVLEAVAWEQPLDRVTGTFAWDNGVATVLGVEAALGSGMATIDGQVDVSRQGLDLAFSASDWPLGFTRMFDEQLGHLIGGMIDVAGGRLTGTFQTPRVTGDVRAEALRVGPTLFRSVEGGVTYGEHRLGLTGLHGERAGGGHYTLSGSMEFSADEPLRAALQLDVEGERLRSLLQLAGEELPAALIDGLVSGRIRFAGSFDDPTAELDLLLKETFALRRGLRVGMRYAEGALRVTGLELPET